VRPAVAPLTSLRPIDERELVRVIAEAAASETPLEIAGASSKRIIGRPMQTAATISTRAMKGITLYEPTEMVMAARAGTPVAQIEAELSDRGQMLAFEPADLGPMLGEEAGQATIGGVFATNTSGARRVAVGAARDHLLGIRAVNGRGEAFKSGGRVMKNVTGYDLCRGLSGSWGTLAVMSEVTFKVLPRPEDMSTLVILGLDDEIAVEVLCTAVASPYEVSGAVHLQASLAGRLEHGALGSQGRSVTALRLENFAKSVSYRRSRLIEQLKAYGTIESLDAANSVAFWGELRRLSVLADSERPVWRISTKPTAGPKVVAAIAADMECHAFYDWSGGLIWAEVLPASDAGASDIRRVVATHGGHATLVRATPEVRSAVEVFQPMASGVAHLSRRLKTAFDPAGILNPGRMYRGM
jgi:glycolate oxidase FAD binding subunit